MPKSPLRIGLLVDSLTQPQWVRRVIEQVSHSSSAEITLVVKTPVPREHPTRPLGRLWRRRSHFLYEIYTWLDQAMNTVKPDAFELVSIEDLVGFVPLIEVEPQDEDSTDSLGGKDAEHIENFQLDVALYFGSRQLKGNVLGIARYGIWSYHHGDDARYRGTPPGFWEVMSGELVTGSMLKILDEDTNSERVIYRSWAPTLSRFSVKVNNNSSYWKSSAYVMRKLRDLYESNELGLDWQHLNSDYQPYCYPRCTNPKNTEMIRIFLRLSKKAALRIVEKLLFFEQWFLAYRINRDPDDPNNTLYRFKYLIPPKDRFWADPFPLIVKGRHYIFFEEFIFQQGKAHISVIEVDERGIISEPAKVLEQDSHLSYPFVFEWEGSYYMIPETGDKNVVELYRSTSFPFGWEFEKVLLEANAPLDATVIQLEGKWWMFVNIQEKGVAVNWDELHLYYAECPLGPWKPHRRNPVKSDVRSARPAGRIFPWNGVFYRPSQDSSKRYGYATTISEIIRINTQEYVEQEVSKILPEWDEQIIGVHTLNVLDEITVIDCLTKRRKFF